MVYLIAGLLIFIATHSVRIYAEGWRTATRLRWGENAYKGLYSLASAAGLVLMVAGFGMAREAPVVLWAPPVGMRHAAALLTLVAFVFLAAAYVPRNGIKSRLHHPMLLGVKTWAVAHLLANGMLAHVVLFGGLLAWAVACFVAARRRDRREGTVYPEGSTTGALVTVVAGIAAWGIFAFWLHGLWIGVRPMG